MSKAVYTSVGLKEPLATRERDQGSRDPCHPELQQTQQTLRSQIPVQQLQAAGPTTVSVLCEAQQISICGKGGQRKA